MTFAATVVRELRRLEYTASFGVPCSYLAPLVEALIVEGRYRAVPREDIAVGMAAGTALAGGRPVVLMQSSGLAACVNALATLTLMYELPLLLVVSHRGGECDSAPEHQSSGRLTFPLVEALGIPTRQLSDPQAWGSEFHDRGSAICLLAGQEDFGNRVGHA